MDHELFLLALLVLSVITLFQVVSLKRRLKRLNLERLEHRLSDLALDVRQVLRAHKAAEPAATPPEPSAAAQPEAPPQPPPVPAKATSYADALAALRPTPASAAAPVPTPPTPPAPPAPPSPFVQSVQTILTRLWRWFLVNEEYRPTGVTMEYAVATTWLVRLGILALVCGVGFFLKWSIDRNLIGPTARVCLSTVFGLALLTGGMRLLGKRWNLLGQGFTGGGLAVLYFSMYALGPLYRLIDSTVLVFALMILVTISAGVLALYANSMLVAIFGIIGGFLTPVLLHTDTPNLPGLYGYLLLLNLGILGIGHLRQWRLLNYLGFVLTWLLYVASLSAYKRADFPVALGFLCLFFAIQSTLVFLYNLRRQLASTVLELIHLVLNAGLFSWAAYALIREAIGRPWPAVMTLGLALYYVLHVAFFVSRKLRDRGLLIALIALAGVYTTLTMPLAMEQESLTIAWAVQAFMFVWLGQRLSSHFLRQLGYGVYLVTLWRLLAFEFPRFDAADAVHSTLAAYWHSLVGRLWTFGLSIASIAAAFFIERKAARNQAAEPLPDTPDVAPAGLASRVLFWSTVVFLFAYLHVELYTMFGYMLPWRPAVLTVLWCGAGAAFLLLYLDSGTPASLIALGVFAAGAIAKTLCVDMPGWHLCPHGYYETEWSGLLALTRWMGFAAVLALLLAGWRSGARRPLPGVPQAFGYLALALLWVYSTLELSTLLKWKLPAFQAGGVSVLWTCFAFAFVAGGIWRNVRPIRFAGLALFLIVVGKVFLVDLGHMPVAYRVIAFMVLGALLLLGSFVYLRASRKFTTAVVLPWILLLGLSSSADAAVTPDRFPVQRPLRPPAALHNEVGRFYLDPAVFSLADDTLSNLRVFDDTGLETPFLIRRSVPVRLVTRRVTFREPAPVRSFRELPGNRVELTVTRDPRDPEVAEIRLESGVRNFEKLVTVHGSTDGSSWVALAQDEPIYDYTRFVDVRKDSVTVARGPYTHYRLTLANITERKDSPLVQIVRQTRGGDSETETTSFLREPFRLERVLFVEQREETSPEAAATETNVFMAAVQGVTTDPRLRQTVVTLATEGRPVTALTVLTDDENFSRAARVEGQPVGSTETWRELASGRLTRIHAGRIREDALTLAIPETRCARLRLTLDNEDNPPVAIGGVRLCETRYEALFFPKAGRTYRIACGGSGFDAPRYDVATVLAPVPSGSADLWELGSAGAPLPPPSGPSWRPSRRAILMTVLVVMATVLSVVIARLARHVDTRGD